MRESDFGYLLLLQIELFTTEEIISKFARLRVWILPFPAFLNEEIVPNIVREEVLELQDFAFAHGSIL